MAGHSISQNHSSAVNFHKTPKDELLEKYNIKLTISDLQNIDLNLLR